MSAPSEFSSLPEPADARTAAVICRCVARAEHNPKTRAAASLLCAVSVRPDTARQGIQVGMPHCLFGPWLDRQLPEWRVWIDQAVREVYGQDWHTDISMTEPTPEKILEPLSTPLMPHMGNLANPVHPLHPVATASPNMPYGTDYTLDTYLVNAKNQFPVSVLREAASGNPAYTLLVLYGATGTGKTHLARALGNVLSVRSGDDMVFCGTTDDLALLTAAGSVHDAYHRLMAFGAIIVDDFDRLPLVPRLADVLPLLMDHCRDQGKLFVCTTRLHPSAWGDLPHLVGTRLDQALIMSLLEADMDIRLRYAQTHSQRLRLQLSRTQLLTLARQCANLRRLMGVLHRLAALRDVLGHDISAQDMERTLSHTADTGVMTPQLIVRVTAVRCGVRPEELFGTSRRPRVVRARQVAMYLCRDLLGSSYPALGRIFGDRDHSTVIHAVKKIQSLRDSDKDTHNLVTELSLTCRQTSK